MSSDLVTRGDDGLLPAQREYIQKYAETGSEADAREALGFSARRVARWRREEEVFRKAFNEVVEGIHDATVQSLKLLEEELPDHIRRLLSASKEIKVTCPFNKEHKFTIRVDHPVVQARMAEMLMKSQGHLIDRRRIEGEVFTSEGLSQGLRMALSLHRDGKQISEQSRRELMNRGLIEDDGASAPGVFEGTAHEVKNGL